MENLKPGIYQHYKGGEYELLFVAEQTEDHSELAVYRSLKDNHLWARPSKMWAEDVLVDGQKRPRFIFLRAAEDGDWEGKYKRALADYQNLLKQTAKDKEEFVKFAISDFLQEILPVYDHLKMSLTGLPEAEQESAWVKGVEYVLKQFKDILAARGVTDIKTIGEKFDHNLMEAMDGSGETVIKEVMPGYTLNGRVIRAAKVIVGE